MAAKPGQGKKVPTRERLIGAARELFYERGYEATGVAEILKRARVNSGSLYYFFPQKHDLLVAVLEEYRELLWPIVMQPVFDQISDPIERVFGVLGGYRLMLESTDCRAGCPIAAIALEMGEKSEAVRKLTNENFETWRRLIRQSLEEAGDGLPADVDRDALATFVLTTMEGGVMLARAQHDLQPFDAAVGQLRNYFETLRARTHTQGDRR